MAITRQNLINYASSLKGLNKSGLKTAIFNNMQPEKIRSYGSGSSSTWWSFYYTDRIASNNECINRYSDDKFYFGNSNTGSAISGMNIEHSMPKSWWGGNENQAYKDLFNLYPSPTSVNSDKSNYPMCIVTDADSDKSNSYTTIGHSYINGKYQWCFEPCDFYKGDFCRGYMYMVTIYKNLTWSTGENSRGFVTMDQNDWPTFKEWAYKLYLQWNKKDPVDEVEIDRNNAIYEEIQYNRNLFVDYPYLAEYIWGDSTDVAFNPETSITTADDDDRYITIVRAPIFSPAGGTYTTAQTVSISCGTTGAAIYYTTDGSTPSSSSTPYTGAITISETTTIKAIAIKDGTNSSVSSATYTISSGGGSQGKGDFKLVTSANQLVPGYEYILVYNKGDNSKVAGSSTGEYLTPLDGAVSGNTISAPDGASVLTLGGSSGAWTFYSSDANGYLYSSKAKSLTFGSTATKWTITGANSGYYVTNSSVGTIRYNISAPRFTNYTSDATNQLVNALLFFRVPIAGDTNKDGSVNISDVTTLVDYILNKNPNPCDANACDVNNDGMVNIADVTALVDIILQK